MDALKYGIIISLLPFNTLFLVSLGNTMILLAVLAYLIEVYRA